DVFLGQLYGSSGSAVQWELGLMSRTILLRTVSLQQCFDLMEQLFRFSFNLAEPRISDSNHLCGERLVSGKNDDWNIWFQLLHFTGNRHPVQDRPLAFDIPLQPIVQND